MVWEESENDHSINETENKSSNKLSLSVTNDRTRPFIKNH